MSVNRYKKYLIVLFEDSAYKDMFLGFDVSFNNQVIQKPVLSGFDDVKFHLTNCKSIILKELNKYENAYILACIDADLDSQGESKIELLKKSLSSELKNRVFIIGSKYEAEHIKREIIGQGTLRSVGEILDKSCQDGSCELWKNDMLEHNNDELIRLKTIIELLN